MRALLFSLPSCGASSLHPFLELSLSMKSLYVCALLMFSSEIFLSNVALRSASSHFGLSSSRRTLSRGASLLRSSSFFSTLAMALYFAHSSQTRFSDNICILKSLFFVSSSFWMYPFMLEFAGLKPLILLSFFA